MENEKKKRLLTLAVLFALSLFLYGQSGTAVVVYSDGDGFTLVRSGESTFYDVNYDDVLGMLLYPGDTILTEENTFLEIQVTSNASLIKIAENTTFAFEQIGSHGGGTLSVAYGRIRAKINKLTNNDQFQVLGSGTTAGVRGTDFGYDLTYGEDVSADQSNEAITTVYCFEGSVKVQQENSETEEVREVLIGQDQMVVTSNVKQTEPLVVYNIEEEIDNFWEENQFVYKLAEKPTVVIAETVDSEDYYTAKIFQQKKKLKSTGGGLTLAGFLMATGGFIVYEQLDEKKTGIGLMSVGAASFVSGLIFLINSTTLPDPPEGWVPPPEKAFEPEEPAGGQ